MTRQYFGFAGHFIGARDCLFHLHTHVGRFCVSTVGAYWPSYQRRDDRVAEYEQIGLRRLYETMVFPLDDAGEVSDWSVLEMSGYMDEDAAAAGHEAMVRKYEELS